MQDHFSLKKFIKFVTFLCFKTWKFLLLFALLFTNEIKAQSIIDQVMNHPPEFPQHIIKQREPAGKYLGPGLFAHVQPLFETYSSSGNVFIGTNEGKLYKRNTDSEKIQVLALPNEGWYWSIEGAVISPDGKHIAAKQIDDRKVPKIKLSGKTADEIFNKSYSKAGQALPQHQFYIVNIQTGNLTLIDHGLSDPYVHILGWSQNCKSIRLLQSNRLLKNIQLSEANIADGKINKLLTEHSETFLVGLNLLQGYSNRLREMNLAWFLDEKKQFIWKSDRTGFDQLYLYDKEGKLQKKLTDRKKNGIVSKLIEVDNKNGWAFFYASSDDAHPYDMQLFRTSLVEDKIEKLVDGPEILQVLFSEKKDSLWVLHTRLPYMMQIDVYSASGKHYNTTWEADLKPVKDAGLAPEYVKVFAADNQTILEAFILKPKDFDPKQKYPLVEYIYGAPHTNIIPRTIFDRSMWNMQHLANKGFIIVMIDSRGTPGRGKEFLNYSYGKFGQVEIKDHAAVIRQLAKQKPYIDVSRVGITGHSWGGYFALKALIDEPELYKAGHLNAAAIDPAYFRIAIEPFMGCLPEDCPEKYQLSAITNKLEKLKAPIMISHGTADDDVPVEEAYKLIDALKRIGYSNYEYVEYPGMDHIIMRDKNWEPMMINFFMKQLKE